MDEPGVPDPLPFWQGDFGVAYAHRNLPTPEAVDDAVIAFRRILSANGSLLPIGSALEVGPNLGINLAGLRRLYGSSIYLAGVEPNWRASCFLASSESIQFGAVINGEGARLPFADATFDLTFTNGVLIHIPPSELPVVVRELIRVSRRHIVCSEYFSHEPQEIPYHGHTGLLWKRDFGSFILDQMGGDITVDEYGFLWQRELPTFDDLTWWRIRKISNS